MVQTLTFNKSMRSGAKTLEDSVAVWSIIMLFIKKNAFFVKKAFFEHFLYFEAFLEHFFENYNAPKKFEKNEK